MPTVVFSFLWNGMMQGKSLSEPTIQQGNKKLNQKRIHPTQKPIELYLWQFSSFASGNILETHAGSFSAGLAAKKLGMDIVGCELDFNYHAAACKRFIEQTAQTSMF